MMAVGALRRRTVSLCPSREPFYPPTPHVLHKTSDSVSSAQAARTQQQSQRQSPPPVLAVRARTLKTTMTQREKNIAPHRFR